MSTPSLYIVLFTLTNAALTGSIAIVLNWMGVARFDQGWKYAAAALFLVMTAALFAFAILRLRLRLLAVFVLVSAAFNVTIHHLLSVTVSGPHAIAKGVMPLSIDHLFIYLFQLMFFTFSYALLMAIMIIVLVRSKIPVASARLPTDLGMNAPAKETRP
jgi:hypothetical protein